MLSSSESHSYPRRRRSWHSTAKEVMIDDSEDLRMRWLGLFDLTKSWTALFRIGFTELV